MRNIFQKFLYLGVAQASYILRGRPSDVISIFSLMISARASLAPNDVECVIFCPCLIDAVSFVFEGSQKIVIFCEIR